MKVLGVHDGHNASAAVLVDGEIQAAVQEERLARVKNIGGVPVRAIQEVMKLTGLTLADFDRIAVSSLYMVGGEHTRDEVLSRYARNSNLAAELKWRGKELLRSLPVAGRSLFSLVRGRRLDQVHRERLARLEAAGLPGNKLVFIDHHLCHAAAAYFGWGRLDEDVLVITCDGQGDLISATVSVGRKGALERIATVAAEDSLGSLYAVITYMMGMVPLEHEYKLMGLAPYAGESPAVRQVAEFFRGLFQPSSQSAMSWRRAQGVPPMLCSLNFLRRKLGLVRFDHLAAGLQTFTEEFLIDWVRKCVAETGIHKLALAGGVFMNVKANQRILELREVKELFIFPSCGDETNSIGAAYWAYAEAARSRQAPPPRSIGAIYWGGSFSDAEVEQAIASYRFASPVRWEYVDDIERTVAELLAGGEVVARAKGPMEFGARALGNRSILADPRRGEAVKLINDMIKQRDFWMPFAPSVLKEKSEVYFNKPKPMSAPYMIITFDTNPEKRHSIPAAIHPYDHTGRPQEVDRSYNPDYYRLLEIFESLTGESIILNTSLNLHGFPMVRCPEDALQVFNDSGLRYVAVGNWLVWKA